MLVCAFQTSTSSTPEVTRLEVPKASGKDAPAANAINAIVRVNNKKKLWRCVKRVTAVTQNRKCFSEASLSNFSVCNQKQKLRNNVNFEPVFYFCFSGN
jgi:hypothetical protein